MQNLIASSRSKIKATLLTWLVAGTLDMIGAIVVYSVILQIVTADKLIRGIASGAFKKEAFAGGSEMIFYGVTFHYFIALAFTIFFIIYFHMYHFLENKKSWEDYYMAYLFGL